MVLSFFFFFKMTVLLLGWTVVSISSSFVSTLILSNVKPILGILWMADALLVLWQKTEGWGSGMKFWELALPPPCKGRNIWCVQKGCVFYSVYWQKWLLPFDQFKSNIRQANVHVRITGNLLTSSLSGKHKCNHSVPYPATRCLCSWLH